MFRVLEGRPIRQDSRRMEIIARPVEKQSDQLTEAINLTLKRMYGKSIQGHGYSTIHQVRQLAPVGLFSIAFQSAKI